MSSSQEMKEFSTPSSEFHFWVRKRLEDGQAHSTRDLTEYARQQMKEPESLRPGVISGVLHRLIHTGARYYSPQRGYYQKRILDSPSLPASIAEKADLAEETKNEREAFVRTSFQEELLELLQKFNQSLRQCCTVDLTEVSEEDFEMIKRIRPILQTLKDLEGELSS